MTYKHLFAIALLVPLFGCGGDGGGGEAPSADVRLDVPSVDSAPDIQPRHDTADLSMDISTPDPCVALPFEEIVPVDLWGPDMQIHGAAAFDGGGIWVTYNRQDVDGGSGFDVFATRIGCDGGVLVEPFLVNESVAHNETDPAVAVSDGTVMFAWQSDSGAAPTNLSVWYRTYHVDGSPRMVADARLDLDPTGFTIDPNAWMPTLAATNDGFALAAAAAPEGFGGFQTWLQRLDADGAPTGNGIHLLPDTDHSQVYPTIGMDHDGAVLVAWERQHVVDPTSVEYVAVAADGTVSGPWHPMGDDEAGTPSLASASGNGFAWLSLGIPVGGTYRVGLYNAGFLRAGAEVQILDNDDELHHTPTIAAGPNGNGMVWFQNIAGQKNDLLFRGFTDAGGAPDWANDPLVINPVPVAPYAAALVSLPGGFFVVWSDGDNPAFRVKGRFLRSEVTR